MASSGERRGETPRRPLPRLVPIEPPPPASSDETPRTGRSDETARQRRRAQQRLIRDSTPEVDETLPQPARKDVNDSFSSSFGIVIVRLRFLCLRDPIRSMNDQQQSVEKHDGAFNPRSFHRTFSSSLSNRLRLSGRSQLSGEPSLLHGFEDEVIVESAKKSRDKDLIDPLAATYTTATPSKSAPTPRIYFEDKSKIDVFSFVRSCSEN